MNVPDVDASFAKAVAAGATAAMPPADMFWGAEYGQVVDPFGHRWSMATPLKGPAPSPRGGPELRPPRPRRGGRDGLSDRRGYPHHSLSLSPLPGGGSGSGVAGSESRAAASTSPPYPPSKGEVKTFPGPERSRFGSLLAVDGDQLDLEDQRRVRVRDRQPALGTVGEVGGRNSAPSPRPVFMSCSLPRVQPRITWLGWNCARLAPLSRSYRRWCR